MTSYAFSSLIRNPDADKLKYVLLCINERLNYGRVYKLINNSLNHKLMYAHNIEELLNNEISKLAKRNSINNSDLTTYYIVGKMLNDAGKNYGENIIGKYSLKLTQEGGKKI